MSEAVPSKIEAHPAWDGTTSAIPVHPHPQPQPPHVCDGMLARRSWKTRYGVAAIAVMSAFVLRYAIYGDLDNRVPFAFFTPAALIAAWYGGIGPGAFAVIAGLLLGDYFFLPAHKALGPMGPTEQLIVGLYTLSTAIGVGLIENLHIGIRRAEQALERERSAHADAPAAKPGRTAIS
jgi:K+-sensing histidine kinase KdpD